MNSKLNVEVAPLISQVLSKAEINIDKVSGIIAGAQGELPAVERKLSETEVKISSAYGKLLSLQAHIPSAKSKIQKLTDEIKKADSGIDKNQLFNLLKVDYKQQAEFFANPVKLQENKLLSYRKLRISNDSILYSFIYLGWIIINVFVINY